MTLEESKGLYVVGIVLLAIGTLVGSVAYLNLASERSNWWNAQMKLDYDIATNNENEMTVDQYNIRLAQSNIWEAQGRLSVGLMALVLGVGLLGSGLAIKK